MHLLCPCRKYSDGRYMDIERSQLGTVDLRPYEEAFCDSDHEDDYEPDDGVVDEGCYPAIKGFIAVERASCDLAGRYVLSYKGESRRFNIIVRQCESRYCSVCFVPTLFNFENLLELES